MRNKTKAASPLRWMLKRYIFLAVAVFLITFAIFPMQGMTRILSTLRFIEGAELDRVLRTEYTEDLTLRFVYSPLNLEIICVLFGGIGFAAALVLFRHLFSRRQGMLIAGLPMTRGKDYALRMEVFALLCLAPMAVCIALYPLAVSLNGLRELFDLRTYLMRGGATLLITLYGFGVGALCASVFGTFWSAALGGMLVVCSGEAVVLLWVRIAGIYLNTMHMDHAARSLIRFSPAYSLYKGFYKPGQMSVLPGILMTAAVLVLSVIAYRKARPENAGHTLIQKKVEPWLTAWAVILGGTAGAWALSLYLGTEVMLIAGLVLGAAAVAVLARMLLEQRIHLGLGQWKIPAAVTVLMLIAVAGLHMDWFGYNGWMPKQEELACVRINPGMSQNGEIRCGTAEEMEAALAWTKQVRDEHLEARRQHPFNQDSVLEVLVIYEDLNGKETWREYSYPENQKAVLPALQVLAKTQAKQQSETIPVLPNMECYSPMDSYSMDSMAFYEAFGFNPNGRVSHPDPAKVREALKKDLQARTLETMQEPRVLALSFAGTNPETGDYEYAYNYYNIYPDDRNVLELIFGEETEKRIDYVQGGFARSEQLMIFRCDYTKTGDEWTLSSYRQAKDENEVREWMKQVTECNDPFFTYPRDMSRRVVVYSLDNLREQAEYNENGLDPEDPEMLKKLPEFPGVWGTHYYLIDQDV